MKYFNRREFDSRDAPGSGSHMKSTFLLTLDAARGIAGIPFVIVSGYRTLAHNTAVGGVPTSAHTLGWAADIAALTPKAAARIMTALYYVGVRRIGYYPSKKFIHADMDPSKPSPAFWDDM